MATVTGIEEGRGRVSILLDGAVALRVPRAHYTKCPLQAGEELDLTAYEDRLAAVQLSDAYEAALTALDACARTEREIGAILRRKGFVSPAIEAVVLRLRESGLLDDGRYALRMAEAQSKRPVGIYAFRRRLRAKGISDDDAEEALAAFDDGQQRDACLQAARGLWHKYAALPPREARARLSQALARRGFGWDAVESAVQALADGTDDLE